MNLQEFIKWVGSAGGVAVLMGLARTVYGIMEKRSAEKLHRDELLKSTAESVAILVTEARSHGEKLDDVAKRTTRLEFVLTGERGENGVRGQVTKLEAQVTGISDLFVAAGVKAALEKAEMDKRRPRRKSA